MHVVYHKRSYIITSNYPLNGLLSLTTQLIVNVRLWTFLKSIYYRSQGFWMRTSTYGEQPDFHFKHELILIATTSAGKYLRIKKRIKSNRHSNVLFDILTMFILGDQLGWSTYNPVNNFLMDNVRIPVIKSREEDTNRDGLNDILDMEIRMPVQQDEEVVSVSLLLLFDVNLYKLVLSHALN